MASSHENMSLVLYTYFRSTSSARVRTAANLKGIPLEYSYVSIPKGEHLSEEYAQTNPNCTVPTLLVKGSGEDFLITQSIAIMEFFEEVFPSKTPLMPPVRDVQGRAHVRQLVGLVACDIQPPTNQRILKRVKTIGGSAEDWANGLMGSGLSAFERLAAPKAGKYSYGDEVTLADVVLAPAVENALRYGVDLTLLPTVNRVFETIRVMEAFTQGDWRHQDDTPQELRKS